MKRGTKFPWAKWLEALERADVPERYKVIGREFAAVARKQKRRHAIMPWELSGRVNYGDFAPLVTEGLAFMQPGSGQFAPDFDPLPAANSIRLSDAERRVLRRLLRGHALMRINHAGYFSQSRGWFMLTDMWCVYTKRAVSAKAAKRLHRLRLIQRDGTGHGWPKQYSSFFRVNKRRLVGVGGFRAIGLRYLAERAADFRAAAQIEKKRIAAARRAGGEESPQ